MTNDIQEKNIDDLLSKEDSVKLEYEAFAEIKPTKKNRILFIVVIALSMLLAFVLAFRVNTQEKFSFIVDKLLEIDMTFIAVIFGAYALFQAMISDDFLGILSKSLGTIKGSNKSFLNLILLYLYAVIINFVLTVGIECLSEDFLLFPNEDIDSWISFVFIVIYLIFNLLIILEIKNFALNLYRMFNVYNAYKITNIVSEEKEDN